MFDARLILLLLTIQLAGGVWLLEQPISSIVNLHDRFIWLLRVLSRAGLQVT